MTHKASVVDHVRGNMSCGKSRDESQRWKGDILLVVRVKPKKADARSRRIAELTTAILLSIDVGAAEVPRCTAGV